MQHYGVSWEFITLSNQWGIPYQGSLPFPVLKHCVETEDW